MSKIRITKEFRFEASHILKGYDGLCKNIHGHSYLLLVTVSGYPEKDTSSSKLGMVMDFGDLKDIIKEIIVDKFDHSLVVNDDTDESVKEAMKKSTGRIIFTPFQPSCENMVIYFAKIIMEKLPEKVSLCCIKLYETPTSYAEWLAEDN
ncbi:MAG: 6-carboxytetrahydropterin synthase [Bacteroidota bacterium]|nr:6-carboxytetrahydropterin synthase [Bacteroidota bacterium]